MNNYKFSFTGKGKEYFKIWIVNIVLTILTLGIYSAWATVRNKRYFYGNTWLAENNFEYHATAKQILFGRVIAIVLLAVYIGLSQFTPILGFAFILLLSIGIPWIVWRSMQFNARMSSYQNVRFSFNGSLKKSYNYFLFIPFAPLIIGGLLAGAAYLAFGDSEKTMLIVGIVFTIAISAIYIMVPFLRFLFDKYFINNTQYGQGQFETDLDCGEYYIIYLKWIGLSMLAFAGAFALIAALGAIIAGAVMLVTGSNYKELFDIENNEYMIGGMVVGIYIPIILAGIILKAYITSRFRNYTFNQTVMDGDTLDLKSTVKARKLFMIYVTNALMVIVTLGLAIPWAKVRIARYTADSTSADINGDITQYISKQQTNQTSLGEEMGDAFDIDGGFEVGL